MRLALIVSIGLLAAGGAAARAAECDNAQSQNELSACAAKAMDKADWTLNEAYEKVIVRLKADPKVAELLRKSQHAWIAFRDSDCAFMSSGVGGGSVQPMIQANCLAGMSKSRTDELNALLNCAEGDLSCPVPRE